MSNSAWPVLVSDDVHDSIAWYEVMFGATVGYRNEPSPNSPDVNYAVLHLSDGGLHLGLAHDMGLPAGQGACVFNIDDSGDFDAILARARTADARFYIEPGTIPTGERTFGILDPDGNRLSVVGT